MVNAVLPRPKRTIRSQTGIGERRIAASLPSPEVGVPWGCPEWFIIAQTLLPALLLLPGTQLIRVWIRAASYAISFLGLVFWWHRKRAPQVREHPAEVWLVGALAFLSLMIFHP